jgi:hypothetical protein
MGDVSDIKLIRTDTFFFFFFFFFSFYYVQKQIYTVHMCKCVKKM